MRDCVVPNTTPPPNGFSGQLGLLNRASSGGGHV